MTLNTTARLDTLDAYIKDLRHCVPLPTAEQQVLGEAMRRGDAEAREKLILHNLRAVMGIAKRFRGLGIEYADLIQIGNEELIRVVRYYNPARGALSTFLFSAISNRLAEEVRRRGSLIRIPDWVGEVLRKDRDTRTQRACGALPRLQYDECLRCGYRAKHVESLDASAEGRAHDHKDIADNSGPDAETLLCETERDKVMSVFPEIFAKLPRREQDVLRWRFGFDIENGQVVEREKRKGRACQDALGESRQRICQLVGEAAARIHKIIVVSYPDLAKLLAQRLGYGFVAEIEAGIAKAARENAVTERIKELALVQPRLTYGAIARTIREAGDLVTFSTVERVARATRKAAACGA